MARPADTEGDVGDFLLGDSDLLCHRHQDADGPETLTNLEALAGLLFLGWFIVFSRQIAAIEADRLHDQLMMLQTGTGDSTGAGPGNPARDADGSGTNEQVAELQSRLSNDR